jgi:uroporphyrinogen-III synthase
VPAAPTEHGPLDGRAVLIPRPPHQASALTARVRAAGGTPVEAATITTEPGDEAALRRAVRELADGAFVGLCVTSGNGARALAAAFADTDLDPATVLSGLSVVGVVGPATAALVTDQLGVAPTVVPDRATGAALAGTLPPGRGRMLLPRGDLASDDLVDGVRRAGYEPVPVVAYRTVTAAALPDEVLADLAAGAIDLVAFTSASTVRGFVTLLGDRPWSGAVVSIGPVTSAACRDLGVPVAAEADPHDLDGLLAALVTVAGRPTPDGWPGSRGNQP